MNITTGMGLWILGFFLFSSGASQAAGKATTSSWNQRPSDPPEMIRSHISLPPKKEPVVHYADISAADPLISCPLDSTPRDLAMAMAQLTDKIRGAVSKIKDTRGDHCSVLQERMKSNSAQFGSALQNQFMASNPVTANSSQYVINTQTQQAMAVNSLLMTASDMIRYQCIDSMDDKVVIQKLIGQVVTLSGLFMGGWQGLSIAAGGQLLGNLPIFRDEIDQALAVVQHYEERNERGAFLCLFRQMLKMSVLLFANEDTHIINGLDLSFQTGPVKTTLDSIAKIKLEFPDALEDVTLLHKINHRSDELFAEMEAWDPQKPWPVSLFNHLELWCDGIQLSCRPDSATSCPLKAYAMHPAESRDQVIDALLSLQATCSDLKSLSWKSRAEGSVPSLIQKSYWQLKTVRDYYRALQREQGSELTGIMKTLISKKYFSKLKRSVIQYQNEGGNQARLNFRKLTKSLSHELARKSFLSLMRENHKTLSKHTILNRTPIHQANVRRRALWAMLDLCQTLDPTLTRLFIDKPEQNTLQAAWKAQCVGPKSPVCRNVLGSPTEALLLNEPEHRAYFYSLCIGS